LTVEYLKTRLTIRAHFVHVSGRTVSLRTGTVIGGQ